MLVRGFLSISSSIERAGSKKGLQRSRDAKKLIPGSKFGLWRSRGFVFSPEMLIFEDKE